MPAIEIDRVSKSFRIPSVRRDTVRERLRIELRLTERDVIAQQGHVAAYDAETENLRRKIHASSTDSHPPVPR